MDDIPAEVSGNGEDYLISITKFLTDQLEDKKNFASCFATYLDFLKVKLASKGSEKQYTFPFIDFLDKNKKMLVIHGFSLLTQASIKKFLECLLSTCSYTPYPPSARAFLHLAYFVQNSEGCFQLFEPTKSNLLKINFAMYISPKNVSIVRRLKKFPGDIVHAENSGKIFEEEKEKERKIEEDRKEIEDTPRTPALPSIGVPDSPAFPTPSKFKSKSKSSRFDGQESIQEGAIASLRKVAINFVLFLLHHCDGLTIEDFILDTDDANVIIWAERRIQHTRTIKLEKKIHERLTQLSKALLNQQQLQKGFSKLKNTVHTFDNRLEKCEERLTSVQTKLAHIDRQLSTEVSERKHLEDEYTTTKKKTKDLVRKSDKTESDLHELAETITDMNNDIQEMRETTTGTFKQMSTVQKTHESRLSRHGDELQSFIGRVGKVEADHRDVVEQLSHLPAQVATIQESVGVLQEVHTASVERIKKNEAICEYCEDEIKMMKFSVENNSKDVKTALERIVDPQKFVDEAKDEVESHIMPIVEECKDICTDLNTAFTEVEEEVKDWVEEAADLVNDTRSYMDMTVGYLDSIAAEQMGVVGGLMRESGLKGPTKGRRLKRTFKGRGPEEVEEEEEQGELFSPELVVMGDDENAQREKKVRFKDEARERERRNREHLAQEMARKKEEEAKRAEEERLRREEELLRATKEGDVKALKERLIDTIKSHSPNSSPSSSLHATLSSDHDFHMDLSKKPSLSVTTGPSPVHVHSSVDLEHSEDGSIVEIEDAATQSPDDNVIGDHEYGSSRTTRIPSTPTVSNVQQHSVEPHPPSSPLPATSRPTQRALVTAGKASSSPLPEETDRERLRRERKERRAKQRGNRRRQFLTPAVTSSTLASPSKMASPFSSLSSPLSSPSSRMSSLLWLCKNIRWINPKHAGHSVNEFVKWVLNDNQETAKDDDQDVAGVNLSLCECHPYAIKQKRVCIGVGDNEAANPVSSPSSSTQSGTQGTSSTSAATAFTLTSQLASISSSFDMVLRYIGGIQRRCELFMQVCDEIESPIDSSPDHLPSLPIIFPLTDTQRVCVLMRVVEVLFMKDELRLECVRRMQDGIEVFVREVVACIRQCIGVGVKLFKMHSRFFGSEHGGTISDSEKVEACGNEKMMWLRYMTCIIALLAQMMKEKKVSEVFLAEMPQARFLLPLILPIKPPSSSSSSSVYSSSSSSSLREEQVKEGMVEGDSRDIDADTQTAIALGNVPTALVPQRRILTTVCTYCLRSMSRHDVLLPMLLGEDRQDREGVRRMHPHVYVLLRLLQFSPDTMNLVQRSLSGIVPIGTSPKSIVVPFPHQYGVSFPVDMECMECAAATLRTFSRFARYIIPSFTAYSYDKAVCECAKAVRDSCVVAGKWSKAQGAAFKPNPDFTTPLEDLFALERTMIALLRVMSKNADLKKVLDRCGVLSMIQVSYR
ncbi:hypothetical protein ADUPG1_006143 [Aduncisulcus paluster]|uniref:Uncharacterized protein n=1 Tax=Aduncisulcus paluster TaxID=2918883 RepID=A0ABQ5KIQ0_9EUKA|nr:hypothetical protein ADUPG1_006143 [Aduncisulcus paluster]